MSFPKYPKYKDSGVEWLGEVPEHWDTQKLRRLFDVKKRIANELGYDVFSITQNGIRVKDIENNDGQQSMDYSKYQIVDAGDFAMNPMDLITGGVDIATYTGVTSPDYRVCALRAPTEYCPQFLLYLLQSIYRQKIFYAYGQGSSQLGRWRLPRQQFNNFTFPIPSKGEQAKIVALLDRETSKIDGLVGEQCQLIELLKEKRQAVISHAVTKGLNPNAPLKSSGIEWLGDVPEHWEVGKLGRLVSTRKGIAFKADDFTDDGTVVVRASDIKNLTIKRSDTRLPQDFVEQYPQAILNAGEIILSTVGSTPEVRNSAVGQMGQVPDELSGSLLNQNTVVFTPSSTSLRNEFMLFALQTTSYRDHLDLHAHGTANQASLNVSEMLDFAVPLPSPGEQITVAGFLRDELSKMDTLAAEAERGIELLQERRTALISAAVTGKIDVREFTESEPV